MSTPNKYAVGDPALKGLNYHPNHQRKWFIHKYYYSVTILFLLKKTNKTAKDAGFRNATAKFFPNQT